jgi:hypothetical protein
MGRTQRKTSKYLELYRKSFKRKVNIVLGFTPPSISKKDFLHLFKEIYPDDVRSMEQHYQFYQEKNKRRNIGKPLYFPNPTNLLYDLAATKLLSISWYSWNPIEAKEKKEIALEAVIFERKRRAQKYRMTNISTQEITPQYVITLINRYWKEENKLLRLYIVQECSKYKNIKTISFFREILSEENDWFIKNVAFRSLQRFNEVAYLPPKGKGKREKYDTLVNTFGCDYKENIGKGPVDIMQQFPIWLAPLEFIGV